jgi:hypothetical protein
LLVSADEKRLPSSKSHTQIPESSSQMGVYQNSHVPVKPFQLSSKLSNLTKVKRSGSVNDRLVQMNSDPGFDVSGIQEK